MNRECSTNSSTEHYARLTIATSRASSGLATMKNALDSRDIAQHQTVNNTFLGDGFLPSNDDTNRIRPNASGPRDLVRSDSFRTTTIRLGDADAVARECIPAVEPKQFHPAPQLAENARHTTESDEWLQDRRQGFPWCSQLGKYSHSHRTPPWKGTNRAESIEDNLVLSLDYTGDHDVGNHGSPSNAGLSDSTEPADGQEGSTGTSTSPDQNSSSGRSSSSRAPSGQVKRKGVENVDKEGSQDDGDNGDDGKFKRPKMGSTSLPGRYFACPYQKSNPDACRCGEQRTRRKVEPGFRDFHRVVSVTAS